MATTTARTTKSATSRAKAPPVSAKTESSKPVKPAALPKVAPAAASPTSDKPAKASNSTKAAKPAKSKSGQGVETSPATKAALPRKPRLVRDSFTMPADDFALIDQLKARALGFGHPVKKSELLRAGLQALAAMADPTLHTRLADLPRLKTGRPGKHG